MIVKLKASRCTSLGANAKGDVLDLPADEARALCDSGHADSIEETPVPVEASKWRKK